MDPIVTRFVDAALEGLKRSDLMRLPGEVPQAMRDPSVPQTDDWVPWKPIPSTVTDAQLDELEREIGLRYPALYRQFLRYKHFCELAALVRFQGHPVDSWREELREFYRDRTERILDVGLIPFADEALMDAGPACFDTRRRIPDGDWPVVFWDHEWVETEKEVQPLFSSTAAMFKCLTLAAESGLNPVYHDPQHDDPTLLPRKQHLLRQFLALDPHGAGTGTARQYWTAWGVDPG